MLYKHQERILEKNPRKTLLCWDTGTGKTIASIELVLKNKGGTLVICPKALKEQWKRIITLHPQSKDILWDVVSKEEFKKLVDKLSSYQNIIVDEAHYFSGPKSQMSKDLYKYIKKHDPSVYLLTATPYLSTPWNIYILARHLGYNWNYLDFKQKFFEDRYIGRRVIPQVKEGIENDIAKLVAKIGDVVKLEDCADIPDQVFETEYFKTTPSQEEGKKSIIETNPIVRFTKYHEIENGFLKGNEYEPAKHFECDKVERIAELADQNKKIAVVCRYNDQIVLLHSALRDINKPVYVIQGATKDRDSLTKHVESLDQCVVIINASCSEGYELPSIGVVVFASLSFSYKDYKQMLGRFLRINRLKKNVYIHLVTSGGVDEEVYKCILKKKDFDIAIFSQ